LLLELYDKSHKKLANLTGTKSPHIQRTLEYGDETLDFYYPTSGPWLGQIAAECYVRTDRQEYVVKAVEKSTASAWRKISCALNIEELEGTPFQDFETVEQTVKAAAEFALAGTGWTVEADADITKKRTIRKEDDTTAWEVVKQIVDTYRVELEIDAVNKRLLFHTRRGRDRGAYFIERLNLRSLGVKTSSYGFYTRLIPIGKDGLHLWQDGQNYIENHQYSDKIITAIWRDERYTVTAALLEDAQARLAEASAPACAYTAELVDLAAQSDKYNALAYDLGDAVLLVSEKTAEREKQRIVKLDEYPDDPLANKAELSNVKQTFAQLQKTEAEMATADAVAIATKRTKKVLRDDYLTKEETKVAISAMAESIELEVSKKYLTVASGEAAINKALKDGKAYTDGKLTEYSTTEETKSLISQSAEQITAEVSKTYATTASVEKSLDTLQAAAKSAQETADKANNDAAAAQAAADKAATDAAAAAAEADKAKQAAADAEANAAADAQEKANAAQAAAEKAAAADAQAKAAAAEAAAKQAAAADAKKKADAAKKEAQDYTDGKLTAYSTTEETKSLISQSAKQITLEVSKTYATQGQLDDYTKTSEVRSRFAMDASSVTIDTGRLTFNSNTIVINSTNFKLDASGNVTAAGTFKSVSDKWEATLRSGGLFMNYDGNRRVELFKASNYDGGYLRLSGTYGEWDATTTCAPNYISMSSASTENAPNYISMRASSKGQSLIMTPEYINLTENSKRRFATELGKNNGVPVSNSAVVQSPDGDVMARLMCGNVLGAPQAKLEFYYKFDGALWSVMSLFYDGSKNRVTLDTGKNAELYIKGRKF
jgi:phage minor structural protein